MGLGIYIHIPYCIQRCSYCDFTTFEQSQLQPHSHYTKLIVNEVQNRSHLLLESHRKIDTIYFGGGTPSLFAPELLGEMLTALKTEGFEWDQSAEQTMEINPATLDENKIRKCLDAGFNRFSVGAQSFNDDFLKLCGRRHSSRETFETLQLLSKLEVSYSFDLLFGLPHQQLSQLESDLKEIGNYLPDHVSIYYLTVPEGHPLNQNRPVEATQLEMFDLIEDRLGLMGYDQYEISNFARKGRISKHNWKYWSDQPFWGVGLSAHSYLPDTETFGLRFWNAKDFKTYENQLSRLNASNWLDVLGPNQTEILQKHEALTDFFHMGLRRKQGVVWQELEKKFGLESSNFSQRINEAEELGLIVSEQDRMWLTAKGKRLCNQVLQIFTFLKDDLIHDSQAKIG